MFYLSLLLFFFLSIFTVSNGVEIMPNRLSKTLNTKEFLKRISQLESSGGQNTDHPVVQSGIQEGEQAIGQYALMPNTVRELINRRRLQGNEISPELQNIHKMPSPDMKKYIEENPNIEDDLANQLATKVIQGQVGDEDRAAYSWKMGHNLTPDRITDEKLNTNPYVQKYRNLKNLMGEEE